jgi:polyribonucleotide nucleotidyltransferase
MVEICEFDLNNQNEVFEFGKVAKQSNGSVMYRVKDCVILATVACEMDNPVGEDFLPMTVQYLEKTYASAKLPGGFIKRENRPGEFETLTSRVIDRSLRPLFPKGFNFPTQVTVMVVSFDEEVDLQVAALNAASAALYVSDIPVKTSVCGLRIGKVDGEVIVNPTRTQMSKSTLDLYLAGTKESLLMIEMKAISSNELVEGDVESFVDIHNMNDMKESELLSIVKIGQDAIKEANATYESAFSDVEKEALEVELNVTTIDDELLAKIEADFGDDIKASLSTLASSERAGALKNISKDILAKLDLELELSEVLNIVETLKKKYVRSLILDTRKRADGRALDEVRPISIETNILPSAHSSCLFTRGQTQALAVATLAGEKDGQMVESLGEKSASIERFMIHYNFPGFCVGEAKPIFAPGRRELGHGNLAKRALESSIESSFTDTVRVVSEILESNGSSSMATTCASSICLKAAGVPISSLVAGVAMGLVVDENDDNNYAVLTDILGLEDHDGDMDFKVTGTADGITAMQMDIKLGGVKFEILENALNQANKARVHILGLMEKACEEIIPSKNLPMVETFKVDPSNFARIIGKAGATIREIIEKFDVGIDLDRDTGNVKVQGSNKDNVMGACEHIKSITLLPDTRGGGYNRNDRPKPVDFVELYEEGEKILGKVVRIKDFGAFMSLPKGGEGLLHISKVAKERVNNINDYIKENEEIELVVLNVKKDRIELGKANI